MLTILAAVTTWMVVGLVWWVSQSLASGQDAAAHSSDIMPAVFVMALVSSLVNGYIGAKRAMLRSDNWSLGGAILCCAGAVAAGFYLVMQIPAVPTAAG